MLWVVFSVFSPDRFFFFFCYSRSFPLSHSIPLSLLSSSFFHPLSDDLKPELILYISLRGSPLVIYIFTHVYNNTHARHPSSQLAGQPYLGPRENNNKPDHYIILSYIRGIK